MVSWSEHEAMLMALRLSRLLIGTEIWKQQKNTGVCFWTRARRSSDLQRGAINEAEIIDAHGAPRGSLAAAKANSAPTSVGPATGGLGWSPFRACFWRYLFFEISLRPEKGAPTKADASSPR
jgi:hypothetical protein